jgi:polyhydroxybutyrate depolymerase
MTHRLACEMPERFAAAGIVMAVMPEPIAETCDPATHPGLPLLLIHGTADPVVPYDAQAIEVFPGAGFGALPFPETATFWASVNGCDPDPVVEQIPDRDPADGTTVERRTWRGGRDGAEVVAYTVHGGGHTWPGGNRLQPRAITGALSNDFSASEALWAFFERYRR